MWAKAEKNGGTSQKSTRRERDERGNRTRREVTDTGRRWIKTQVVERKGEIKDISKTSRG